MPTIPFDYTPQQAQRMATAVGRYMRLANPDGSLRDATVAEVKTYWVGEQRRFVQQMEKDAAVAQIAPSAFDPA